MKVFVTGGNGFIGKHVVKDLVSRGVEVISFDIVAPQQTLPGVRYYQGTILDTFSMTKLLKGCDAVFHLAAILGVKRADTELLKCMTINAQGTLNVLGACIMSGVPYCMLSSSSEVFGDMSTDKLHEESAFNPKSGYAISKLAAEKYLEGFHKEHGLDFNIVRFFNVYGPGQVAEFVVPRFIKMIQNGMAPHIYGEGDQVRSFCHIADSSRAMVDIFLNKALKNQAFNVGNDEEPVTIKDLANTAIKALNSDLKPVYVPFASSDRLNSREIFYRVPNISKIKKYIDYKPRITLAAGIRDIIDSNDIPASWGEELHTTSVAF